MKRTLIATCVAFLVFLLTACSDGPKFSLRRVVVDGDEARTVGLQLVRNLRSNNVHISESAEKSPIIRAKSEVKNLERGIQVFTIEVTDGSGLSIRTVVSTQDFPTAPRSYIIDRGVSQAVESLISQWEAKQQPPALAKPQAPPLEQKDPNKHFSTS